MKSYSITIKPFGEHAVLIEWSNTVSEAILNDILLFNNYLRSNHLNNSTWETIPAYNSLTLINRSEVFDYKSLSDKLVEWYNERKEVGGTSKMLWKLPVCYDLDFGIDLIEVAEVLGFETKELIAIHTKHQYTVYGIGFLPGFMYLGGLPVELEIPRRADPRLKVEKGSVGLAGKQTGIYPQNSPGGWNIIGNCPVSLFNPKNESPCFVSVGDKIQFYQISKAEYDLRKIEAEVGIYHLEKETINA